MYTVVFFKEGAVKSSLIKLLLLVSYYYYYFNYRRCTVQSSSSQCILILPFFFFLLLLQTETREEKRERDPYRLLLRQQIIKTQVARLFLCVCCASSRFRVREARRKRAAAYCGFSLTRGFRRQSQAHPPCFVKNG